MKIITSILLTLTCITSYAQTSLIHNVKGYTMQNGKLETFNAVQFTNDKIDTIFKQGDSLPNNQKIVKIDGKGKVLLPGLIDAHGHVMGYGLSLLWVNLNGSSSEESAAESVAKFNNQSDKSKGLNVKSNWIFGRGWNQVQWENNQFPSAKSLDKYFPEQPVYLRRVDGHAVWVNSAAMEIAGVNKETVAPSGGEIIKDESGNPTGVFVDNAMELITKVIPPFSYQQQKSALTNAMQSLARYGLTSVHDAGISVENIALYKELAKEDAMAIRINGMLSVEDESWLKALKAGPYISPKDFFKLDSVKISADGALGSRGAALITEYSDFPDHKGLLLYSEPAIEHLINTAMSAGFQVNTHAIGDNANFIVLNHYEKAIKKTNSKSKRHRIEHAQILQLSDIPRFSKLGIIPSMQATHATSDKNMAQDRLGKERLSGAYAWRKLLEAGSIIANGSDFPVESPNPFFGLHAAITRQDHNNQPLGGWISEEKMTRTEAFASFTIDAAYSGHQESIIGSIEAGKKADFILVNDDIFEQDETTIWKNKVLATWVNGQKVFSH